MPNPNLWSKYNLLKYLNLVYFIIVGAHESGLIGEDPKGIYNRI